MLDNGSVEKIKDLIKKSKHLSSTRGFDGEPGNACVLGKCDELENLMNDLEQIAEDFDKKASRLQSRQMQANRNKRFEQAKKLANERREYLEYISIIRQQRIVLSSQKTNIKNINVKPYPHLTNDKAKATRMNEIQSHLRVAITSLSDLEELFPVEEPVHAEFDIKSGKFDFGNMFSTGLFKGGLFGQDGDIFSGFLGKILGPFKDFLKNLKIFGDKDNPKTLNEYMKGDEDSPSFGFDEFLEDERFKTGIFENPFFKMFLNPFKSLFGGLKIPMPFENQDGTNIVPNRENKISVKFKEKLDELNKLGNKTLAREFVNRWKEIRLSKEDSPVQKNMKRKKLLKELIEAIDLAKAQDEQEILENDRAVDAGLFESISKIQKAYSEGQWSEHIEPLQAYANDYHEQHTQESLTAFNLHRERENHAADTILEQRRERERLEQELRELRDRESELLRRVEERPEENRTPRLVPA